MTTAAEPARRIVVAPLGPANRAAVMTFLEARQDRPRTAEYRRWRYEACPAMEAVVAMAGDECIGTMFALRRRYRTPEGLRDCLEPFEWHASEAWRAQAPGLRIVQQFMRREVPVVAVAGTDVAAGLLVKLKWSPLASTQRHVLPLTGRFLRNRGRSALVASAFDVLGRSVFHPRRPRRSAVALEPAATIAPAAVALAERQLRFGLMRIPDPAFVRWLGSAPASVGHYLTFHLRVGEELAGWIFARVFSHRRQMIGELLEVFLADEHRAHYGAAVAQASAALAACDVDALVATTTCSDTIAALRAIRFRPDDRRPGFAWWGRAPFREARVLLDGALADHAFFPTQTSGGAAWLGEDDAAP